MYNTNSQEGKFENYFPQLVYTNLFKADDLNKEILNFVLEHEVSGLENDINRATIGGYQPKWPNTGILDQDVPCINHLRDTIIFPEIQKYASSYRQLLKSSISGNRRTDTPELP